MDYALAGYSSLELVEMLNDIVGRGIKNLTDNELDTVQDIKAVLYRRGFRI
jgi:hypothetical protein